VKSKYLSIFSGSKQMNGAVEILCVDMNGTSSGYGEGDESSSSSHEKFSFRSDISKAKTLENSIQVEAAAGIIKRLPRDVSILPESHLPEEPCNLIAHVSGYFPC
jgi:hypothetical protein